MSSKYDETIEMIVSAARFKMMLNSHKGQIEDLPFETICDLAIKEIEELRDTHKPTPGMLIKPIDGEGAIIEAADVFNFLIAAAYQSVKAYRGRK